MEQQRFYLSDLSSEGLSSYLSRVQPHVCVLSASDYIIKEKTVLLQKKDSEGFGFVLRGAKGETGGTNKPPACISLALAM